MNAPAERVPAPDSARPVARWTGAFDMSVVLDERKARDVLAPVPVASVPHIVGNAVLVGHSCPLVEMGLIATLSRRTLHDVVTFDELAALPSERLAGRRIDVVVADRTFAARLAGLASGLDAAGGRTAPRIVLIGAVAESPSAQGHEASYDACLPLECRPGDLLETVNALIGSRAPAKVFLSGVGATARNIEGIALRGPDSRTAKARPRGGLAPGALRRVREAVEQRLDQRLELTDLAAVAGMSRSHFARAFKESTGESPHRYVMMRRVALAAEMIKDTDRRLTDISLDAGFSDPSHFARVFTRIVGDTPSAYRHRHR